MAVIPKQVVKAIATRLRPDSRILTVVADDGSVVDENLLDRLDLDLALLGRRVESLVVGRPGGWHQAVVEAVEPGLVSVWLRCSGWSCGDHDHLSDHAVPARSEAIVERIGQLTRAADQRVRRGALLRARRRRSRRPAWTDPVDHHDPDELDDELDDAVDDAVDGETDGDAGAGGAARVEEPVVAIDKLAPVDGFLREDLDDLTDPPLCWGPRFGNLERAVARVANGSDLLADLLPDVDTCTVRSHGRRIEAGLPAMRSSDAPAPGLERQWLAEQLRVPDAPHHPIADTWQSLSPAERDMVQDAVATALALFDGRVGAAAPWCEMAVELLDGAAADVPASVRTRVGDPIELLASASVALAVRSTDGAVPGRDVTGMDLWFAAGGELAELGARGPVLGANDHGDLPATGLVIVVGDERHRRPFMDAIELGADQRPTVRIVRHPTSGPHLAALATTRGSRPVLLNSSAARSPFAIRASLPHLRRSADVEQEAQRVAQRWLALMPGGRDDWWEALPSTYLPALLLALLLDGQDDLCAGRVMDAVDEDRIVELQDVCRRSGRQDVADRLSGMVEVGIAGQTRASIRVLIASSVPRDPPPVGPVVDPTRLGRRAVILPEDAVAVDHAVTDLAEAGCDVLWDDVRRLDRGALWCARRPGLLTVLGYPTLSSVNLPGDLITASTVIGLHGCGDLTPLAGRTVEVDPTEAALFRGGTLTLVDPVHHLLEPTVAGAHRDAVVRSTVRMVYTARRP